MDKRKIILLVDDNVDLVEIIRTFLSHRGYNVLTAYNGKEALSLISSTRPDLIALDLTMPVKNGLEVYKEISTLYGRSKFPVLIMTAHERLKDTFAEIEVDGFLSKPFELEELEARIHAIFDKCDKPRVILADRKNNRRAIEIAKSLEQERYRTVIAENLSEIKEVLRTATPDFLLMEYLQQEMRGDEFIRNVIKIQSESSGLPAHPLTILTYSYSGLNYEDKSLLAGANKYLGNPPSCESFIKAIRECEIQKN